MIAWTRKHLSNKFVAVLVVSFFVVTTFACFSATTASDHSSKMTMVCDAMMSLADNTIIQTGVALLIVLAAAWLSARTGMFPIQFSSKLFLTGFYGPPLFEKVSPREYSYLSQLFSSGIIHSKLHIISL